MQDKRLFVGLLVLMLASIGCQAWPGILSGEQPVPIQAGQPGSSGGQSWLTYRNDPAGYQIDYPADWLVRESPPGVAGSWSTSFAPAGGGGGVGVIVQTSEPGVDPALDLPNTRCQQVTIAGIAGVRCLDTIALSWSTTLRSQGKTYVIGSSPRRTDPTIYEQMLVSLQLVAPTAEEPPAPGVLTGIVRFNGYGCASPVPPCTGPYPNYALSVYTPDQQTLTAQTVSGDDGTFTVNLPPGAYVIPVTTGPNQETRITYPVAIVSNQTTQVTILLNAGVR